MMCECKCGVCRCERRRDVIGEIAVGESDVTRGREFM